MLRKTVRATGQNGVRIFYVPPVNLSGGRQINKWRPPLKLSGGRHIKYSHSILPRGTNGFP